jgi:hypothetical protein
MNQQESLISKEARSFITIGILLIATLPLSHTHTHTHTHTRSQTSRTETDPYELFAVGELLGPGYESMRVYIEDRPTS